MPVRAPTRATGLDALRGLVTLLVVFHHAALTYGAIGGWFDREVPAGMLPSALFLGLLCSIKQPAYFPGYVMLFAAGGAAAKRGWLDTQQRRTWRRIPWLALPVFPAVALSLRGVAAAHVVKFLVTGTVACANCYVLAGLLLRVPKIRRIV